MLSKATLFFLLDPEYEISYTVMIISLDYGLLNHDFVLVPEEPGSLSENLKFNVHSLYHNSDSDFGVYLAECVRTKQPTY